MSSQCEVVKVLVNAGAAIAAASSSDTMDAVAANAGSTPLHLAAMKVSSAADWGWRQWWHETPTASACHCMALSVVSFSCSCLSHQIWGVSSSRFSPHCYISCMSSMLAQGEVGVIRLLLRANRKLMGLVAAADPALAAAAAGADAASGAREDVRRLADKYGKTAGRLAWDMQR